MIVIEEKKDYLKVTIYAELTLADFQEFESAVTRGLKAMPKIKLLMDLTNMSDYTLDVAWEDIKFTKVHAHDFKRIATVTHSRWLTWLGWLSAAFLDAEIKNFENTAEAEAWLHGG